MSNADTSHDISPDNSRTIMIVEDDRDIRESLVEILAAHGYAVTSACDGAQALQMLTDVPQPDLILLDLMMPRMNGFAFREAQLKHPEYAAIPVAIVSADGNIGEKAAQLRASAFIKKPLNVQPLLASVEKILGPLRHKH